MIADGAPEFGRQLHDQLHPERTRNRMVRRLERLGVEVHVRPKQVAVQNTYYRCAEYQSSRPPRNRSPQQTRAAARPGHRFMLTCPQTL
jgi:hypothetical protein